MQSSRSLANKYPQLVPYWDQYKNDGLKPELAEVRAIDKYWWKCPKGHSWESALRNLTLGYFCPNCREIEKKTEVKVPKPVKKITVFTSKKSIAQNGKPLIWYRCEVGHEWTSNKTSNNPKPTNCVYCSNRRLLKGFNDLKTRFPQLAREWHPTKNKKLTPSEVLIGSHKFYWWKCGKGHEWSAVLWRRQMGSGCKKCTLIKSPKNESNFSKQYPKIASLWHSTKNKNLKASDFAINSTKLVWWECRKKHVWQASIRNQIKKASCPKCDKQISDNLNRLIVVKPELKNEWNKEKNKKIHFSDLRIDSNTQYWWVCPKGHEWRESPKKRVSQSGCVLCSNRRVVKGQNDLLKTHPKIAKMWNFKRNGELKPDSIFSSSHKKVWWVCPKNHEFQSEVSTRVKSLNPCPYCSNHKLLSGFNDLATVNPKLAREWHPTKNGRVLAKDVSPRIKKNAWWKCPEGHEWNARIQSRNEGMGCPFCSNSRVWVGFNDLKTSHSKISEEWNYERNKTKPEEFLAGTNKKVWWVCKYGHEWNASIYERSVGKSSCPVCSNRKVLPGFNDLLTLNPRIAQYISSELNGGLDISNLGALGTRKLWWECKTGHSFKRSISEMNKNTNCPTCIGKTRLAGFNDLATTHPLIAAEWHPTKNGALTPQDIQIGSAKKIWWVCQQNHSWFALPYSRQRSGCPKCATFGFDQTKPSRIYFIANTELSARKIGIENNTSRRTKLWKMAGWDLLHEVSVTDGLIAKAIEREVLAWIRVELGLGQYLSKAEMGALSGATETFSSSGPTDLIIKRKINQITKKILSKLESS